mgnify:CR=1 FL=1
MTNFQAPMTYGMFHLYNSREAAFSDILKNIDSYIDKGVHSIVETGTGKTGEGSKLFCDFLNKKINNTQYISYELDKNSYNLSSNIIRSAYGDFPKLHCDDMFSYFEDYPDHYADLYFLDAADEELVTQFIDIRWIAEFHQTFGEEIVAKNSPSELMQKYCDKSDHLSRYNIKIPSRLAYYRPMFLPVWLHPETNYPTGPSDNFVPIAKWIADTMSIHHDTYHSKKSLNLEFFLRIENERSKKGTMVLLDDVLYGRGGPILHYLLDCGSNSKWDIVWSAKDIQDQPCWSNVLLVKR